MTVAETKVIDLAEARRERGLERWETGADLAARWGVSVRTLERWRHEGLPFVKSPGGAVRYSPSACDHWFRSR